MRHRYNHMERVRLGGKVISADKMVCLCGLQNIDITFLGEHEARERSRATLREWKVPAGVTVAANM